MAIAQTDSGIWVIEGDDWISRWVREGDRLDHDCWLLGQVEKLMPAGRRGACLDIGAYIGDHTERYASMFGRVHAFEPQLEAYECLVRNMAAKGNVECYNRAIGRTRMAELISGGRNAGASKLGQGVGEMVVGGLPDDIKDADFIKIDVEGMEPEVLVACEGLIRSSRPYMLIEQRVCDGNEELVGRMLARMGYVFGPVQGQKGEQYDLWCEPVHQVV